MKYTKLEILAMKQELAQLESAVSGYVYGEYVPVDGATRLTADQTDRAAAEQADRDFVDHADLKNRPAAALGQDYANRQEDQRIRRDNNIARQGHKRLMQGCLETAWRRTIKLEEELKNAE